MKDRLWDDMLDRLENKYGEVNIKNRQESRSDDMGNKIISEISYVEFEIPEGKLRVEKWVTPMIIDKKTYYSNSSANHTTVEYITSDTEKTSKIKVFKLDQDNDEWLEINGSTLI